MRISQARIILSNESPIEPPVLVAEDGDEVSNCIIEQGIIIAKKDVWFNQCAILGKEPKILGELPPSPAYAKIHSCQILGTKLPDAYYRTCYFSEK